jgi:hypothetical protein
MSPENAAENAERALQKYKRAAWISQISFLILFSCYLFFVFRGTGPLNTVNLEGTIVILDENGEPIPYRDTIFTFYSHYAPGFFRSEESRQRNYYNDERGFGKGFKVGNEFPLKIPNAGATLFFHTRSGKYAAVVDIAKGDPATGLAVELRPRFSAKGRLVDNKGTPLGNYEFSLEFSRYHDLGARTPFDVKSATQTMFEYEYCETDADGFFTAERLIPGLEYSVDIHQPRTSWYSASVKAPILQPEQYREPYDLGDVSVKIQQPH